MKYVLLLSAAALALPAAASAEETEASLAENTIIVTGHADGYSAFDTITATRTPTPLIDVPQTITVVTREQLEDQAVRSIGDILRYVPGTTVGQGEGNRDQITLRGQNTTADFFLDGVRDDVQHFRNLYNIERVEILKGPYALIFGRGGGGGIINRVQKAPSNDGVFGSLAGGVSTLGAWDVAADVNLPVSASGALRLNAFYEDLANHRDFFDGERYAVNPYLAFDLGGGWRAGLSYEYTLDDRVPDRGVPALACAQPCTPEPLEGFDDTFFGVPGFNRTRYEAHVARARLDGQLADGLTWSTTLLFGDYDKFYNNVYANGPASSPTGTVSLGGYTDPTQRQSVIAQSNIVWEADLGGMENTLLLGVEYADQETFNSRRDVAFSTNVLNLANIVYPTVSASTQLRDTRSNVRVFSAYVQDQIQLHEMVEIVVGARFDRFEIEGIDFMPNPDRPFARTDEEVSPRLGLILKPQRNLSLYGSYSQSFLPRAGDQFATLSVTQQNLAPERFTNYEIGAKWDIAMGLSATLALFQLDRTNATTPDPANPAQTINVGETRTRGVEAGLTGRLTDRWQISGGYSHQKAVLAGNDFVRLGQVPAHQFSLWNRYDLFDNFGFGVGVIHQSSQFAAIRTSPATTRLPGFTRFDAALFLRASDRVELQLNVENLLDEEYFSDAHNNQNISVGAPFNARLTARIEL